MPVALLSDIPDSFQQPFVHARCYCTSALQFGFSSTARFGSKRLWSHSSLSHMKFFTTFLAILAASYPAHAETIEVLGQKLNIRNPSGYCSLGKSPRERELMAMNEGVVAQGARVVHIAIRCTELSDFKRGAREHFDHWVQIQLLGQNGQFKRLDIQREAFLSVMARNTPKIDMAQIEQRINASFKQLDLSSTGTQAHPVGRDANAVYMSMRMNLVVGDATKPISALGAVTLVNSLPLSALAYEASSSAFSRTRLQSTLHEFLGALLTHN